MRHALRRGSRDWRPRGAPRVACSRWRKAFGGVKTDPVRELETGTARLRKALSELTPEKLIRPEAASGFGVAIVLEPKAQHCRTPPAAVPASRLSGRNSDSRDASPVACLGGIRRPGARHRADGPVKTR